MKNSARKIADIKTRINKSLTEERSSRLQLEESVAWMALNGFENAAIDANFRRTRQSLEKTEAELTIRQKWINNVQVKVGVIEAERRSALKRFIVSNSISCSQIIVCVYSIFNANIWFYPTYLILAVAGKIVNNNSDVVIKTWRWSARDKSPGFPRLWSLFPYLLPREVRERVYEPAHQELLEDYTLAYRKYRTKWSRRWLSFCFTVRTAMMWAESLRVMACSKGAKALRWLAYAVFGGQAIKAVRGIIFELFGRLF